MTNNKNILINTTSVIKKKEIIVKENKYKYDNDLKSPICSIMGHVDAGKTSLMDIIKNTNITEMESGGITQDIGSYFINMENILDITKQIKGKFEVEPKIPGILLIDTPGHEAFDMFREQGSSLCDIAILVIDIIDGVKPQTIESIKLLIKNKTPFVIAATKLDLVYGYNKTNHSSLKEAFKEQDVNTIYNIEARINDLKYELDKENIKSEFYFKNKKPEKIYSIIPISNRTKEGLSDLLSLMIYISQNWMNKKITYVDELDATIMKTFNDKRDGWVLDVILKNGTIKVGDKLVVMSSEGAKKIVIRNLIKEKIREKSVRASCGVRIIASNANSCYVGTKILEYNNQNIMKVETNFNNILSRFKTSNEGINIFSQTIPELDALYKVFNGIMIASFNFGKLTDNSINRIISKIELTKDKELMVFIYFGKLSNKDIEYYNNYCNKLGIKFISNDIVYKLKEEYEDYKGKCLEDRQKELVKKGEAIYPCEIKIIKRFIFMKGGSDNLMFGVRVRRGKLRIGMPFIYLNNNMNNTDKSNILGKVINLQKNNEDILEANENDEICVRFDNPEELKFGRHFDHSTKIVSKISRSSIDILKKDYRDKMTKNDWEHVIELKNILNIK
jgi:translation initiation factor 5B